VTYVRRRIPPLSLSAIVAVESSLLSATVIAA
jgi:hypothetical protein